MKYTSPIHVLSRGVITHEDHILLAYDPQEKPFHYYEPGSTFYYLPGGHIDHKESATNALLREIEEETGYVDAHIEGFLGVIEHTWAFDGDDVCCHTHELNLIFKVYVPRMTHLKDIAQIEDHVAFHWVPLINLETIDLRPHTLKTLLQKWLSTSSDQAFSSLGFPD